MADLTISVTVSANINGRKFTITEECTVDDVYDVAVIGNEQLLGSASAIEYQNDGTISMSQSSPSLAVMVNASQAIPAIGQMRMDDGVNADSAITCLLPGQFAIFHEHIHGAGIVKYDATLQTTYFDALTVQVNAVPDFFGYPDLRLLTANTQAS